MFDDLDAITSAANKLMLQICKQMLRHQRLVNQLLSDQVVEHLGVLDTGRVACQKDDKD